MPELTTFTGGCHCGAVRYRVQLERLAAVDCNCSICQKKGFLHVIVPAARFTLLQGEDALSTYTFNTGCQTPFLPPLWDSFVLSTQIAPRRLRYQSSLLG
jgi:hypothetical protein